MPWTLTPKVDNVTFGKEHYDAISSDLSKAKTREVLSALNDSPALDIFKARPIKQIVFTRKGPAGVGGFHDRDGALQVNTVRRSDSFGQLFVPGSSWTVSSSAADKTDAMGRTLIHETGHHLQVVGRDEVRRIAEAAFRSPARKQITKYAAEKWFEYLAETWAAFHVEPEKLKAFDPVGVRMVEDILRKLREILGI